MFFEIFVEFILVLIAYRDIDIFAIYDAVVGDSRYLFQVDNVGTVDAHESFCRQAFLQFLHAD